MTYKSNLMDTLECIQKRRSVRRFLDIPVEMEKLGNILDAGRLAPSAGNLQNWGFIIIRDPANKQAVAEACARQMWVAAAPVIIAVCGQSVKGKKFYGERAEKLYNIQNCAAAAQNMILAATAQDLGSCWIGSFDEELLSKACGIPAEARPMVMIAIGYAAEKPKTPSKHLLENMAFLEKYGNRIADIDAVLGYTSQHVQKGIAKVKDIAAKAHKKLKQ